MKRERLQVLYSGRVQGVGFRFTVKMVANGFEVTGIVRNLADGRVEMDGEVIRDSSLAVAGLLNLKRGGPSVFPDIPEGM